MNENKIKRKLSHIIITLIVGSILLCTIGALFLGVVLKTAHQEDHMEMKAETEEYTERIHEQLDDTITSLSAIARAFETSDIIHDPDQLEKSLIAINQEFEFLSLSYLPKDGSGIRIYPSGKIVYDWDPADTAPAAKEAVDKAFTGKSIISRMFTGKTYTDFGQFLYVVPVYENDEVVGVIAAGDTLNIFADIAAGNTVMGGSGHIHILNQEGTFLVHSDKTVVKEPIHSIFDSPYITNNETERIQQALEQEESIFGEFTYEGKRYHYYLAPIGLNGWSILCVDAIFAAADAIPRMFSIVAAMIIALLGLLFFLVFFSTRRYYADTKQLMKLAYLDPVTGAKNTSSFDEEFQEFLSVQKKDPQYSIAALNIHNFKSINDLFGYDAGDIVLKHIKALIENHLLEGEFFCRESADIFYLFLLETEENVLRKRLLNLIHEIHKDAFLSEYGYPICMYSSVAINGDREQALLAMQSLQGIRDSEIVFYNPSMLEMSRKKMSIEAHMQTALEQEEFKLYLQPKAELQTDRIIGAEALVRWQKPDGSFLFPDEFIPIFEANHFCVKLDMYMVKQVCQLLQSWIQQGITPIPISINQSKRLFAKQNYTDMLEKIVDHYNVPHHLITLEILEGIATEDLEQLRQQIENLQEKGFRVSIDDFGSGYSSLNMLYELKIDELKLDKGFLRKVSHEDRHRRMIILEQTISFSEKLDIVTVAEGIETAEDRDTMRKLGCHIGQGYFYSKPLPAEAFFEKYMKQS